MKPINRTTTLIYKKGRRVKVEKHIKRIYYPDHNNPKVLKPIITEPKDAKVYYTGYKHEIIDHDLLIGFSPKYNDLPFLRFTDPKTENTWALWIKGFGGNVPKTGIRPKSIGKLKYGMHYEIDPNVELKFEVLGHMIRKVIIVHKRPEWNELTFIISRFGGHLITGKTFGKQEPLLAFRKNDIKPLFKFLRPYVKDSSGNGVEPPKIHVPMMILNNIRTGVWELKIKLSEKWLDEAKYPIYIDPTITLQPDPIEGKSTYIGKGSLFGYDLRYFNFGTSKAVSLQTSYDRKYKTLIQFDLSDLPSDITIISSVLQLVLNTYMGSEENYKPIKPHRVLLEWNEGNKNSSEATDGEVDWIYAKHNQVPWMTEGASDIGTDIAPQEDPDGVTDPVWQIGAVHEVDLSNSTQAIVNGAINNGWLLRNEIVNTIFDISYYSDDEPTEDYRPKLVIEYRENTYWKIGRVGWEGQGRPFKWIFD